MHGNKEQDPNIERLQDALLYHQARCREIQADLNKYREKCPGCRCRILPGETCECCVSTAVGAAIDESLETGSEGAK